MPRSRNQELLRAVGARLARIRKGRGCTQEQLAEAMGIQPVSLSRLETGHRALSLSTLALAADSLGVSVTELLDIDRPIPPAPADPSAAEIVRIWARMDEETRDMALRVVKEIARR